MTRTVKQSENAKIQQLIFTGKDDQLFFFFDRFYRTKNKEDDKFCDLCIATIDCDLTMDDVLSRCQNPKEVKRVETHVDLCHIHDLRV